MRFQFERFGAAVGMTHALKAIHSKVYETEPKLQQVEVAYLDPKSKSEPSSLNTEP